MDRFYVELTKIYKEEYFLYGCIILFAVYQKNYIITALSIIIIAVIYSRNRHFDIVDTQQNETKNNMIKPTPLNIKEHPKIVDFFYSIRELYFVNPSVFYALINNVDQFFKLYNQMMNNEMLYCSQNYQVAETFYRNALNNYHSLIYQLDLGVTAKFHDGMGKLHFLLYQYLVKLAQKCNSQTDINVNTSFIDMGSTKAANYFDERMLH